MFWREKFLRKNNGPVKVRITNTRWLSKNSEEPETATCCDWSKIREYASNVMKTIETFMKVEEKLWEEPIRNSRMKKNEKKI